MASEESQDAGRKEETSNTATPIAAAAAEVPEASKKRPRLDLTVSSRERKRGKSMFGILLGTLNKAKKEDEDRNTSEAAKKRADLDRRLQQQIAEEHDTSRRLDEIKRDRQTANRKEEELKLRQSIYQARRTRLSALSNFILTSDDIPDDAMDSSTPSVNPLAPPPRTHPPPLYYLPAALLPSQAAFLQKRKAEVKEASEKEWQDWLNQRKEGYDEVDKLRARVEEEEKRTHEMRSEETPKPATPVDETSKTATEDVKMDDSSDAPPANGNTEQKKEQAPEKEPQKENAKDGDVTMAADGDEAVEY
ncbi:hypothetical protein M422DRAFT_203525 [Sphaerobolus stellatus SS14]|nr:hypothetical protein M422DRAFT_203525 [Sphaerobolus stellatus SS14]